MRRLSQTILTCSFVLSCWCLTAADDAQITTLVSGDSLNIRKFLHIRSAVHPTQLPAPSLSPDGRRLSFVSSITGRPQLWVVDTEGGWPQQLTFGESVTFHHWSENGKRIVYAADREGNEREGYSLISPDGLHEEELLPASSAFRSFGAFADNGRQIIYAVSSLTDDNTSIKKMELNSKKEEELYRGSLGIEVKSISPNGKYVIFTEVRGEDANSVSLLSTETGQVKTLFDPAERSIYRSFSWKPTSDGFYMVTNHGRNVAGVAVYDLSKEELTFVATPSDEVDLAELSKDGRFIAWTVNDGGFSKLKLRDLRSRSTVPSPNIPDGVICHLVWASESSTLAIALSGPQVPGDIWTWKIAENELYRSTNSTTAGIDMARMVIPEQHSYATRDGLDIHGLLYRPKAKSKSQHPPVVVKVHGGPTMQARPVFDPIVQYLLTRGFAVFEPNFRGSTGYGKQFTRLNDQQLRNGELTDLEDALGYLSTIGIDAKRAAIMGRSYGGYLSMAAISRLPAQFKAAVAAAGISDWPRALRGVTTPDLKASDRTEYGDVEVPKDLAFLQSISPLNHAKNAKAPVLLVHGINDARCPVSHSDDFAEAVKSGGGIVQYLRFDDEGHQIKKLKNRLKAYEQIASFLETHLKLD